MISSDNNSGSALPANWSTMTPGQKRQWRLNNFLNPPNVEFFSDGAKKAYQIRAKRLVDVYNIEEPDRVPVVLPVGELPYILNGVSVRTAMYDYVQAVDACRKFNEKYSADLEYYASPAFIPGRVMDMLGSNCCIQGNVPSSLTVTGNYQDVKAYCRKLIEECGNGGGYILTAGCTAPNPKLENLKAMVDAAREFGVYKN